MEKIRKNKLERLFLEFQFDDLLDYMLNKQLINNKDYNYYNELYYNELEYKEQFIENILNRF